MKIREPNGRPPKEETWMEVMLNGKQHVVPEKWVIEICNQAEILHREHMRRQKEIHNRKKAEKFIEQQRALEESVAYGELM